MNHKTSGEKKKNSAVSDKATLEQILCDTQERNGMSRKESVPLVPADTRTSVPLTNTAFPTPLSPNH